MQPEAETRERIVWSRRAAEAERRRRRERQRSKAFAPARCGRRKGEGQRAPLRAEAADNDLGEEVSSEEQEARKAMWCLAALKLHVPL